MSNLPFITEPKAFTLVECGNEETGVIKLIKKGFISVAEQAELDSVALQSTHYQLEYGELLVKIMDTEKVSQKEAEKVINKPTENLSVSGKFLKDIKKITDGYYALKNDNLVKVTTALKYRLLTEEQAEEFEKLNPPQRRQFVITKEPIQWTLKDSQQLPNQLFEEILEFLLGEQMGGRKADFKELFKNATNSSENLLTGDSPTGKSSTGNSKESEMIDSIT